MSDEIDWLPMIRQRLALDILPSAKRNDYWDILELTPPGPDVSESMVQESNKRLATVAPLSQFIEPYIVLTGDILSGIMYKDFCAKLAENGMEAREEDKKEFQKALIEQNREVLRSAIYPILAVMMNTQVIDYGSTIKAFM